MAGSTTGSVRQVTMDLLRDLGITTVFGNPGSTEIPFLADWPNDFRYILALQEASAVAMADGFARATGQAGFVSLHSAAGVGHALGNVFTAFRNQAPLVILAGQQARSILALRPFLGATDAPDFPKPYVKWSSEPARAEDVPAALAHAYHIAMQRPRGPTFVSVPADDWTQPTEALIPRRVSHDVAPDPAMIGQLADALALAKRPVLVIGPEVDEEAAGPAAVALAERIGAPVWASPFSCRVSFPEEHRLFAGFLAAAPEAVSSELSHHDLVLVIGAPVFTFHVAGDCALFRSDVPLYQLTADGDAAATAPVGTAILGSMRLTLAALNGVVPPSTRAEPAARKRPPPPRASNPIPAEFLLHQLGQAMPKGSVLVEEAPSHRPAMQAQLPIRDWGQFYTMASGGLGYSLPASVGIALAQPGRRVVCLIGDGSMMYSVQALWTAVQHRLPITVVVINNGGYGAMRSFSQVMRVRGVPGIDLPGLDFPSLARGMGCESMRIERAADLGGALQEACSSNGPVLVDVAVDPAVPKLYDEAAE